MTRIESLGIYLEGIIEKINEDYLEINADYLGLEINNYSLDRVPTLSTVETWITGDKIYRDVYSFRSKNSYSSDRLSNLKNIGFFENFEKIINSNNKNKIFPDIKGIESITCLNSGALENTDSSLKTAIFDIQIQITYREAENENS